MISEVTNNVLDVLLPRVCLVCDAFTRGSYLCRRCTPLSDINPMARCQNCFSEVLDFDSQQICRCCRQFPLVFPRIRYIWEYRTQAKYFIHSMKYRPSPLLMQYAGVSMAEKLDFYFGCKNWDLIIPIPASRQSIRSRTLNVVAQIARPLSKALNVELTNSALKHCGYKEVQASLRHLKRIHNVKNAFKSEPSEIKGRRILLIDDVITTGATTTTAAMELLEAGAISVDLFALARSENWNSYRARIYKELRRRD